MSEPRSRWGLLLRGWRAARLDRSVFHEVRDDPPAVLHAVGIVAMAGISLAAGHMSALAPGESPELELSGLTDRLLGAWIAVVAMMVGWIIWGAIVYLLVGRFLKGRASFNESLRVLGIGYGPAILLVALPLPFGWAVGIAAYVWVLVVSVVAVRTAHEIDWLGAFFPAVMGWFVCFYFVPLVVLNNVVGRS